MDSIGSPPSTNLWLPILAPHFISFNKKIATKIPTAPTSAAVICGRKCSRRSITFSGGTKPPRFRNVFPAGETSELGGFPKGQTPKQNNKDQKREGSKFIWGGWEVSIIPWLLKISSDIWNVLICFDFGSVKVAITWDASYPILQQMIVK